LSFRARRGISSLGLIEERVKIFHCVRNDNNEDSGLHQLSTANFQIFIMKRYFLLFCCMFSAAGVHAAQTCKPDSIPASTPDSQLVDNGNGTITDSKTSLMWKKCLEGLSGSNCESGSAGSFTWQEALQQPIAVNTSGGFAGHSDWRLSNINELVSIVEEQCYDPAINLSRFPNTPSSYVWSGSPYASSSDSAWNVHFYSGSYSSGSRGSVSAVRLVRGGN
jgi:hypothetical protein